MKNQMTNESKALFNEVTYDFKGLLHDLHDNVQCLEAEADNWYHDPPDVDYDIDDTVAVQLIQTVRRNEAKLFDMQEELQKLYSDLFQRRVEG